MLIVIGFSLLLMAGSSKILIFLNLPWVFKGIGNSVDFCMSFSLLFFIFLNSF